MKTLINKIKQFYRRITYICSSHDWFGYMFENPFSIWGNKEVRKMFVLPNLKLSVHSVMYEPSFALDIFGIYLVALSWKSKYGEPRYEDDPFIQINLFGICFKLRFACPIKDSITTEESYWESILEYYGKLYEHKVPNLYKIIKRNTWLDKDGYKYNTNYILTDKGFFKYLEDKNSFELLNRQKSSQKDI
jgi:hypothetical protein